MQVNNDLPIGLHQCLHSHMSNQVLICTRAKWCACVDVVYCLSVKDITGAECKVKHVQQSSCTGLKLTAGKEKNNVLWAQKAY